MRPRQVARPHLELKRAGLLLVGYTEDDVEEDEQRRLPRRRPLGARRRAGSSQHQPACVPSAEKRAVYVVKLGGVETRRHLLEQR